MSEGTPGRILEGAIIRRRNHRSSPGKSLKGPNRKSIKDPGEISNRTPEGISGKIFQEESQKKLVDEMQKESIQKSSPFYYTASDNSPNI